MKRLWTDELPDVATGRTRIVDALSSVPVATVEDPEDVALVVLAPELAEALKLCLAIVALQNGNLHDDINQIQDKARSVLARLEGKSVSR